MVKSSARLLEMIGFLLDLEINEIKVSQEKPERTFREYVYVCTYTHTHVHKPWVTWGWGQVGEGQKT